MVLLVYFRNFFVSSRLQIVSNATQSLLIILAEHDVIIKPKQKYYISLMTTILTFFQLPMIVKKENEILMICGYLQAAINNNK